MCLFSVATCRSQCKLRSFVQMPACQECNLHCDVAAENKHTIPPFSKVSSLTLDCNGVFVIKAYSQCVVLH